VEKPHAAAADDDRDADFEQPGPIDAAQHARGRLEEDSAIVGETLGNPPQRASGGALPHEHELAEAAGIEQVLAEARAHRLAAALAERAFATRDVVRNDDAIADRDAAVADSTAAASTAADFDHIADQLVTEHGAVENRAIRELEEIGAAEAATPQA